MLTVASSARVLPIYCRPTSATNQRKMERLLDPKKFSGCFIEDFH